MTATRIRETADGVLYRLSELVGYGNWKCTHIVIVKQERHPVSGICTVVLASTESGWWYPEDVAASEVGATDPDAMIEAMGYTVINGEGL